MPVNVRDMQHVLKNIPVEDIARAQRETAAALQGFLASSNQLHDMQQLFAAQAAAQSEELRQAISAVSYIVDGFRFPALQIAEMINAMSLPTFEASGLDEALQLMSRLSAPDVDRMVHDLQNQWRAIDAWEPIGEAMLQPDAPRDSGELIAETSRIDELHAKLMQTVLQGVGQINEQERSLVELVTLLALWTGHWLPAIFFVLEVLRQRALAARAVIEHEGMRFDVELEWDADDRFWVTTVPALNDTSAFGATRDVALNETADAIRGYVRAARTLGLPLPEAMTPTASKRTGSRSRPATSLSTA